ncbi:SH3 domain-containing protein [Planomonospora corallina]|uniref:SH3 domain-containing protein n=1 Tax=Planomonospora corallina TaxID=1806052 RepID=A0ABV8I1N9_9ACTN
MIPKRIAGIITAAAISSGGLTALSAVTAAPASAAPTTAAPTAASAPICVYRVRNAPATGVVTVHAKPSRFSKVIGAINPRYPVSGKCKLATTNWRRVQAHNSKTYGYVHKSYLKKVARYDLP